jgi:hypothetical protein
MRFHTAESALKEPGSQQHRGKMERVLRKGQCSRCGCTAFTGRIDAPGLIDVHTGTAVLPAIRSGKFCGCWHPKSDHWPGWFGRPLIRAGRAGPVIFTRALLILGPLALIVMSLGGSVTESANGKTHVISSSVPRVIESVVAAALLAASSPPARVALGWMIKSIGLVLRAAVVLLVIAIAIGAIVVAGTHFHWWR